MLRCGTFFGCSTLIVAFCMTVAWAASARQQDSQLPEGEMEVVNILHIPSTETSATTEISAKPNSKITVRLLCVSGFLGLLISAKKGDSLTGDIESCDGLSSEQVKELAEAPPPLPHGLKANALKPIAPSGPPGFVGGPIPYEGTVEVEEAGDYTLVFAIMRVWQPSLAKLYKLKIHVA